MNRRKTFRSPSAGLVLGFGISAHSAEARYPAYRAYYALVYGRPVAVGVPSVYHAPVTVAPARTTVGVYRHPLRPRTAVVREVHRTRFHAVAVLPVPLSHPY